MREARPSARLSHQIDLLVGAALPIFGFRAMLGGRAFTVTAHLLFGLLFLGMRRTRGVDIFLAHGPPS